MAADSPQSAPDRGHCSEAGAKRSGSRDAAAVAAKNLSRLMRQMTALSLGMYTCAGELIEAREETAPLFHGTIEGGELEALIGELRDILSGESMPSLTSISALTGSDGGEDETENPFLSSALADAEARLCVRGSLAGIRIAVVASLCRSIVRFVCGDDDGKGDVYKKANGFAASLLGMRLPSEAMPSESVRIACPPGRALREAAEAFARTLDRLPFSDIGVRKVRVSVESADDYSSAAQDVSDGAYPFCVLPFSNAESGVLSSFRILAERAELRLCMALESEDGSVFALYSKNPTALPSVSADAAERYLSVELMPEHSEQASVGEIITALSGLGLDICRCSSLPLSYTDRKFAMELTFSVPDPTALASAAMFLSLTHPSFSVSGCYEMIGAGDDI